MNRKQRRRELKAFTKKFVKDSMKATEEKELIVPPGFFKQLKKELY